MALPAAFSQEPGHQCGGRLWQRGRLAHKYDRLGPCLGSGGMGSVWAARVGDGAPSSGCVGRWVAIKAIPLELATGVREADGLQSGLRECLSTFKDLSPVHVVRYEDYWLEAPAQLPQEIRTLCERQRSGGCGAASSKLPSGQTGAFQQEAGGEPATAASVHSLRFCEADVSVASSGLDQRWPRCNTYSATDIMASPIGAESCGFEWERDSEADEDASAPATPLATSFPSAAQARCREAQAHVPNSDSASVVLLIEMELMCTPPDERVRGVLTEERSTLRAWLQLRGRTFSDAADVFAMLMLSVRHIHRKRLVHADLKPDNIFLVAERSKVVAVRIGDFGLAGENLLFRQFSYGLPRRQQLLGGTPGYAAPEQLCLERDRMKRVCSDKADIFACAVILLELLMPPFGTQMERVQALDKFNNLKALPEFIDTRLPKTRSFLREMSESDPAMRLSAEEVCKRLDKEVRKELCRSGTQLCGELSLFPKGAVRCAAANAPARFECDAAKAPGHALVTSSGHGGGGTRSRRSKGRRRN